MDLSHSSKTLKIFDENNIISRFLGHSISIPTKLDYSNFFVSTLLILPFRGTQLKVCRRNTASRGRTTRGSIRKRFLAREARIDFTSGYIFLRPFERGLRGQCIFNCADYSEWLLTAECVCIIPRPAFIHSSLLFMEKARSNRLFSFFSFFLFISFFSRPCPEIET